LVDRPRPEGHRARGLPHPPPAGDGAHARAPRAARHDGLTRGLNLGVRWPTGAVPRPATDGSLRLEAETAVDADGLGVHVVVGDELEGHRRELVGGAEALREQHVALEVLLEGLRLVALAVDRGVDEAR